MEILNNQRATMLHKWLSPIFIIGIVAFIIYDEGGFSFDLHWFLIVVLLFGFLSYMSRIYPLADKVIDRGSSLLIVNGRREREVQISEIKQVENYIGLISLKLKKESPSPHTIDFIPRFSWRLSLRQPVVESINRRISYRENR